jgi:hypothetical protein
MDVTAISQIIKELIMTPQSRLLASDPVVAPTPGNQAKPRLDPLPHDPRNVDRPTDPVAERTARLDEREAVIQARENRLNEILKNNELGAARLDDAYIDSQIIAEYSVVGTDAYDNHPNITPEAKRALSCLTLGVFVLRNGAVVTGESLADSPEVYDHSKGIEGAKSDAKRKIWYLESYVQRNKLMGL